MSLLDNVQHQNAQNYLVPSSGGTHIVPVSAVFSAAPQLLDWRQFSIDSMGFQPQGAFIDNSQGTGTLTINIQPNNWNVNVPAGTMAAVQFPSPNGVYMYVTGSGQATIQFVDFPVLPGAGVVNIGNTVNVNVVSPSPLPVVPTVNNAGTPYQVTVEPTSLTPFYSGAITGATLTTGNIAMPANTNLRKLSLSLSGNAAFAAAGVAAVIATLNGTQIYEGHVYLGTAETVPGMAWNEILDFSNNGLACGAAGNLVVTIGTALSAGILDVNAYAG
jgi:hypothetical protein